MKLINSIHCIHAVQFNREATQQQLNSKIMLTSFAVIH